MPAVDHLATVADRGSGPGELFSDARGAGVELLAGCLRPGLVIAPCPAPALDAARDPEHGLVASLAVMARTLGMLLRLAGLTAFGLRRFHAILAAEQLGGCPALTLARPRPAPGGASR